ncbi:MAG: hypothetical protein ACRCZY_10270 [Phocaeicola sp.]
MKKKKMFFSTVLALVLLAGWGCARHGYEDTHAEAGDSENDEMQSIKIGLGHLNVATSRLAQTRGSGAVGGLDGSTENVWQGEKLTLFGIRKEGSFAKNTDYCIKGKQASAPMGSITGKITWDDGKTVYYPLQGGYTFMGYYANDATVGAAVSTDTTLSCPITIDGTQDLLLGYAKLTADQKIAITQKLIENGKLSGSVSDYLYVEVGHEKRGEFKPGIDENSKKIIQDDYDKTFSSYSARRGIQPSLIFRHSLARLVFNVRAGEEGAIADTTYVEGSPIRKGVYINAISVESINKGTIVMGFDSISFQITGNDKQPLFLKQRPNESRPNAPLITLKEIGPKSTESSKRVRVGESLLIMPGETEYYANIVIKEYVNKEGNPIEESKQTTTYNDVKIVAKDKAGNVIPFEASKSYNVTVTVYSNQIVEIEATLTGWLDGGDIDIDPEENSLL